RVGIVGAEEDALWALGNNLHHQVGSWLIGTHLDGVGRLQEADELGIQPKPQVDIAIGLDLEAIDGAAHRPAAIDQAKPSGEIHPRQRWTPLAFARLQGELDKRNLNPVVAGHSQQHDAYAQAEPDGRQQTASVWKSRHAHTLARAGTRS